MRWLLFLAVASIPLLPTDGLATSCGFGCPYLHCPMFATRGLLGPVVEAGDDALVLEVERASGRDAPEPGERITLDRKFFHYSDFEAGARLLVFLQGDRPSSDLIPLHGDPPTFDCDGRSIPAGEVLAVGFLEEDACFDKLQEWQPECGGCLCASDASGQGGALWALGLLILASRAWPGRHRSGR